MVFYLHKQGGVIVKILCPRATKTSAKYPHIRVREKGRRGLGRLRLSIQRGLSGQERDWTWNQAFLRNLASNSVTENSFSLNFLIHMRRNKSVLLPQGYAGGINIMSFGPQNPQSMWNYEDQRLSLGSYTTTLRENELVCLG